MQLLSLIEPHRPVVLLLVGLGAHTLDSLELVNAKNGDVLGRQSLMLLFLVGSLLTSST